MAGAAASVKDAEDTDEAALAPATKRTAVRVLTLGIFQAVLQHVLALQSEVTLFTHALGGDQAATARSLSVATGITGVAGLFLNQVGGKLSDSLGRKLFFLTGPLVNILAAAAVLQRSGSIAVLMLVRILKSIFTTFSGTVMCQAALADICSGQEMALVGTNVQVAVGLAVVLGPYLESAILKISKGDPRSPFKAVALFSIFQLLNNGLFLPETLVQKKRSTLAKFFESLASVNPFTFIRVYFGKSTVLKKLLTIQTLQYCADGKVTSDLFQMWSRNNLAWAASTSRDFVAFWGAAVTAGGAVVHPYLLRKLSTFTFSTVGNVCVWMGLTMHGILEKGISMWGAVPFLVPGVNGGSAHAIKALSLDIARSEGYGNGEFSAWANNMRALAQSVDTVLLGMWYARCKERGLYQGTAWFLAGFIGAGLPQLIIWGMPRKDFEPPTKVNV
uniref:Major facilitator superfamily (MFS) profile domain-containing protein n=1 Tax=Pyrodinium bahamense TaxID=73915 RepID=A0A7S0AT86_9DINO